MPKLSDGSNEQLSRELLAIYKSFTEPEEIAKRKAKEKTEKFIKHSNNRLGL